MRRRTSSADLIVLSALLGFTAAVQAQNSSTQQNVAPAPETGSNPAAQPGQENRKTSGTNDQSGPSNAAPTADQNKQGDQSSHSVPGRTGKEEPTSHAPSVAQGESPAPLVNGAWNVPGAADDSQTVPAKFSQRNDGIDKLPILGMSLDLSDAQKRSIADAVRGVNAPVATSTAKVSDERAMNVTVQELPASAGDPNLRTFRYVRLGDRILLIEPANRFVVGKIVASGTAQ